MRLSVKVKPNSKEERIEKISDSEFLLWVKAVARENKANQAVLKLLSEYFDRPKTAITVIKGHKSKNKIVSID
jgi:uncharacterized protein (TIGR00251 family)